MMKKNPIIVILIIFSIFLSAKSSDIFTDSTLNNYNLRDSESFEEIQFDVIDVSEWNLSYEENYLLSSIEGLINSQGEKVLVVESGGARRWMEDLNNSVYSAILLKIQSLEEMLNYYSSFFDGIIIFDNLPESGNIATPLVNITRSVLVHKNIYSTVQDWDAFSDKLISVNLTKEYVENGFSESSTKGEIYQWAFDSYFQNSSQNALGMINSGVSTHIRSQLCAEGIFTFYQPMYCEGDETAPKDSDEDLSVFEYIIENTPQNIIVYGYMFPRGCNEHPVVSRLSATGKYLVPTDYFSHMPFWKNLPIPEDYEFSQDKSRNYSDIQLENKLYIAGIYSDGDNLQYVANFMKSILWDDHHGQVPTTYEISPSIYNIAPAMVMLYYENMTEKDYFVNGVGGKGYVKSNYASEEYFTQFWTDTHELMVELDQRELRTWDSGNTSKILDLMTDMEGNIQVDSIIEGYFGSKQFKPTLVENIPFMRMRVFSASDLSETQDEKKMVNEILKLVTNKPEFLTLHLNCWNAPYNVWKDFVKMMEVQSGGKIVFVTSGQLSKLMNQSNLEQPKTIYTIIEILFFIAFILISIALVFWIQKLEDHDTLLNASMKKEHIFSTITSGILLIAGITYIFFNNSLFYEMLDFIMSSNIKIFFYPIDLFIIITQISMLGGFIISTILIKKASINRKDRVEFLYYFSISFVSVGLTYLFGIFNLIFSAIIFLSLGLIFFLSFILKMIIRFFIIIKKI